MGFEIAKAYVTVKADSTGLREEVRKDVEEAGLGQKIKVALGVDKDSLSKADLGGLFSNLAPFIIPTVAAVGNLTGALGLVPAAVGAAGIAFATAKVGVSGFSDAVKKGGDDLKALPPNAREAATAIRGLGPAWENLHLDVQQRLFQGVGKDIQRLGIVDLPVLRTGMDQMAGSLNQGVHYFTAWATSSKTVSDFKLIMDNSSISTQNLMRSLQPILGIIRDLAATGSTFFPQLSSGFAIAAQHAADFISHARQTGQLAEWMQAGINAVHGLLTVLGNLFQIIVKVAQAPPLFGIDTITILSSVTGWILKLVTAFPELIPMVEGAIVAWKAYTIAQWALNAAMEANPIGIVIAALAALVAAIVIAWNHSETFRTVVLGAWGAIQAATESAFGAVRSVISSVMGAVAAVISGGVNTARGALNWFGSLPGLISGWFNSAVSAASGAIGSLIGVVGSIPGRVLGAIGNLGSLLYNAGANVIQGLVNGIMSKVSAVTSAISSVASTIRGALPFSPAKWGPLSGSGSPDIAGAIISQMIADGMLSNISSVVSATQQVTGTVFDGLPNRVVYGSVSDAVWNQLLDAGWKGDPNDHMEALYRPTASSSSAVVSGSVSDSVWQSLLNAGWKGDPNDHMEALYPPDKAASSSKGSGLGAGSVVINITQTSGSPQETGRAVALALRTVS